MKRKGKVCDANEIAKENRMVRCVHKEIKYLSYDDRFLLRSAAIREELLNFYLKIVITSSLDFHFILMTLNKIEELRSRYIKAYSNKGLIEDQ